jgi:hypothetical protein
VREVLLSVSENCANISSDLYFFFIPFLHGIFLLLKDAFSK